MHTSGVPAEKIRRSIRWALDIKKDPWLRENLNVSYVRRNAQKLVDECPPQFLVPYNTAYCDGSATSGATLGKNSAYLYGKDHGHAGETAPTTLSVTPGQFITLQYVSGSVVTGGGTAFDPTGTATTGITPYPAGGSDTETFPTNVVKGRAGYNGSGTVNTVGTAVTWASGDKFDGAMMGNPLIWIDGGPYTIVSVDSPTGLTIATSAGTHSGLNYFFWGAKTSIGGVVGAFTDADGNVISNFDWAGYGGVSPVSLSLTSVNPGGNTYNGSFPLGGNNAYAGTWFKITGFTDARNNGRFFCIASSTSSLNLENSRAVQETHAATAQQLSFIILQAPAEAAFLSLGINDTQLWDNTGSFTLNAVLTDAFGWNGDVSPFARFPVGVQPTALFGGDNILKGHVFFAPSSVGQMKAGSKLIDAVGQLFPRRKN